MQGFAPIPLKLPKVLGEDLAGVVVEAPAGSKVGSREGAWGSHGGWRSPRGMAAAAMRRMSASHRPPPCSSLSAPPLLLVQFKPGDRVFAGTGQTLKGGDQGGALALGSSGAAAGLSRQRA
jgi:NADPH:quinone reductase-like Zn-dependent oxidoreductase